MKKVIIESPWAGNVEENQKYAIECLLDSLQRDEAPYASHLLYTRALDDLIPDQRERGLKAAMAYVEAADLSAVYTDRGISRGMAMGIRHAQNHDVAIEYRELNSLRQTGRTTGMVEEAVKDVKEGKSVLIFAASALEADRIIDKMRERVAEFEKVENGKLVPRVEGELAPVYVVSVRGWESRCRGIQVDSRFIDHHAWRVGLPAYEALARFGGPR